MLNWWLLDSDEWSTMLNSVSPHGYLVITVIHTKNSSFKSAKIDDLGAKCDVFLYSYLGKRHLNKGKRDFQAPILGKIVRFTIAEIYFIYFFTKSKEIWNNTEKTR